MIFIVLEVEDLINGEFEHVIDHPGNQHLEDWAAFFNGRVGIYLYQPDLVCLVYHEIITEQLKAVLSSIYVDLTPSRTHRQPYHLSYLALHSCVSRIIREVLLELCERYLVAWFLIVLVAVFLDWVVGEVDEGISVVVCWIFLRRETEVALSEEEDFVVLGQQCPDSDVEFALFYQHRAFDVLLDDEAKHSEASWLGFVLVLLLNYLVLWLRFCFLAIFLRNL